MKFCPECGVKLDNENFKFCPECGYKFGADTNNSNTEKSRGFISSFIKGIRDEIPDEYVDKIKDNEFIDDAITQAKIMWHGPQTEKEKADRERKNNEKKIQREKKYENREDISVVNKNTADSNQETEKESLKTCPNCSKQIPHNAIRCKYCKTMLKTYSNNKSSEASTTTKNNKVEISETSTKQKIHTVDYSNLNLSDLQEKLIKSLPVITNPSEYEENIINKYAEFNSEERKELLKDCWTITKLAEEHNIDRKEVQNEILTDEFLEKDLIAVFKVNPNNIRSLKILYRKPLIEKHETEDISTVKEDAKEVKEIITEQTEEEYMSVVDDMAEEENIKPPETNKEKQERDEAKKIRNAKKKEEKETKKIKKENNKKSRKSTSAPNKSEKKQFKEKMTYYFGGFRKTGYFKEQDEKNKKFSPYLKYQYVKEIVEKEFKSGTLLLEDVDERVQNLMDLDVHSMKKDLLDKGHDTSSIKSLDDLIKSLDDHYGKEKASYTHCEEYRKLGLVEKYAVDVTGSYSFNCIIKKGGFKNIHNGFSRAMQKEDKIYTGFVFLFDEYLIILMEYKGIFDTRDMGVRTLYFKDLLDIEFLNVSKIEMTGSDELYVELFIHFKSLEKLNLAGVSKKDADELKSRFDKYLQENPPEDSTTSNNNTSTNADELLKYAELYKQGILTEEEFEAKKKELL